jgi:hypothetical protein
MPLSHARNKIVEMTSLDSFNSVYTPNFQFNFLGDYELDNEFLVHKICINM